MFLSPTRAPFVNATPGSYDPALRGTTRRLSHCSRMASAPSRYSPSASANWLTCVCSCAASMLTISRSVGRPRVSRRPACSHVAGGSPRRKATLSSLSRRNSRSRVSSGQWPCAARRTSRFSSKVSSAGSSFCGFGHCRAPPLVVATIPHAGIRLCVPCRRPAWRPRQHGTVDASYTSIGPPNAITEWTDRRRRLRWKGPTEPWNIASHSPPAIPPACLSES